MIHLPSRVVILQHSTMTGTGSVWCHTPYWARFLDITVGESHDPRARYILFCRGPTWHWHTCAVQIVGV